MSKNNIHLKQFGKELFTYGVMGGIAKVVQFILFPIFTRVFSVTEYGVLDSIAVFTSFVGMGIGLSLPSALNRYFYDKRVLSNPSLYSTLLFFTSLVAVIIFSIIVIFSEQIGILLTDRADVSYYIILGALSAVFTSVNSLSYTLLRLRKKIVAYNVLNIIKTISFVVLSLTSVFILNRGLEGIYLSMVISSLIPFFIGLYLNYSFLTIQFDASELIRSLKFSLPMFPAVFVSWANKQTDRIIILTYVGLSGVGIFGAGFRISNVMQLFSSIYQKAWGPFAMEIMEKEGRNEFYRKAVTLYATFVAVACLFIIGFSQEILWVIAPPEYHEAFYVIPWLLGATVCHGSLGMINLGTILSEKTGANSIASWSGYIVNLSLTIFLVKNYGIQGAAIGTFIAEMTTAIILWNRSVKLTDVEFNTLAVVSIVLIYIVTSIVFIKLNDATFLNVSNFVWRILVILSSTSAIVKIGLEKSDYLMLRTFIVRKFGK